MLGTIFPDILITDFWGADNAIDAVRPNGKLFPRSENVNMNAEATARTLLQCAIVAIRTRWRGLRASRVMKQRLPAT